MSLREGETLLSTRGCDLPFLWTELTYNAHKIAEAGPSPVKLVKAIAIDRLLQLNENQRIKVPFGDTRYSS